MVHRTNIYKKLNVTSQFGLLRIALETGYFDVSDVINDDVLIKEN
ncbi:helix-turn-helix transcriptional regulator [Alteromonas gracilis]